jgi:endoglucanase
MGDCIAAPRILRYHGRMATEAQRRTHEKWLCELTGIPTAAGHEDRVIDWIMAWLSRRRNLQVRWDSAGNLIITCTNKRKGRPIFITAHLDHPAFVVRRMIDAKTVELEFRGGVHDLYFEDARIEIFDHEANAHRARIVELKPEAKPFKRAIAQLTRRTEAIQPGDVGRWQFRGRLPRISKGILHTYACDDLSAVAAALATLDLLRNRRNAPNVGLLFTRAEEVGFVGTLAACKAQSIPKTARLICLENSRSFPDSPIGGGPIMRVGDRLSVFDPKLTNRISAIMMDHQQRHPEFRWQRKLMPGGACEATAFSTYGYESTCICLPLGNYHNMSEIDEVQAGRRPAKVGPEFIAVEDYHGMIDMLVLAAMRLDSAKLPSLEARLDRILEANGHVLER